MSKKWIFRAIVAAIPCFVLVWIEAIGHAVMTSASYLGERIGHWVDSAADN